MEAQPRRSAKVVLLDREDRTLLFCGVDPLDPDKGRFWFPPGGGLEADETAQQAAVRELREEVGLLLVPDQLSPELMQRESSFSHEGIEYRQLEHYFVVRIEDAVDPVTDGWTAVERRSIQEHRWWALDELRRTTETVFPEDLASLLTAWRRRWQCDPPSCERVTSHVGFPTESRRDSQLRQRNAVMGGQRSRTSTIPSWTRAS